jgi:hypothetical protein
MGKRSLREVIRMAAERILTAGIYGISRDTLENLQRAAGEGQDYLDHINVTWERTWTISADLTISTRSGGKRVEVNVNWSSTYRTPASARAAVSLYAELTDLACELETFLSEFEIVEELSND